ncbi:hypothetical protein DdX_17906 [Ditylenchus destructor]|uniref:Uncharacterized protein n=1 Tax=Ditylenchus destructor TaxID=166010 RepID=A0AAD4MKL5_9BILA|nr:hypothetical protein DdX_17906 [Ditylenchus destructor]
MFISNPLAKNGYKSRILTAATIVAIAVCFGCNVAAVFQVFPLTANIEGCLVFACLLTNTSGIFYTYTKIICGSLNLIAGGIFLLKWCYSENRVAIALGSAQLERNRTVNRIAVLVICLELCLNFTPQVTAIILFQTSGIVVGSYIGAYNFMGCCFDIFISSSIYSWRLHRSPASFVRASNS